LCSIKLQNLTHI